MLKKIRKFLDKISDVMELLMAIIVLVAVVVALLNLKTPFLEFVNSHVGDAAFLDFMTYILNIVIGIEFFKMLCKPGTDTVLEVLMFVVARHMIVHDTSAVENLLTIIGIAIIVVIKRRLLPSKKDGKGRLSGLLNGIQKAETKDEICEKEEV